MRKAVKIAVLTVAVALVALQHQLFAQTKVTVGEGATVTLEAATGDTSLKVENNAIIDVQGKLRLKGSNSDISSRLNGIASTDKYTVIIENGAELDANYFKVDNLNRNGIRIRSGGRILGLNNGTFDNMLDTNGVYLNFAEMSSEWSDKMETYSTDITTDITGSWTVTDDDADNIIYVFSESYIQANIDANFPLTGRGQVVVVDDRDTGAPISRTSISRTFGGANGYNRGVLECKILMVKGIDEAPAAETGRINLYDKAGDATHYYTLTFDTDGYIKGELGSTPTNLTESYQTYVKYRWYTLKIVWDITTEKWNVWVDGVHRGTFNWTSARDFTGIYKVEIGSFEGDSAFNMYVDDVSITPLTPSDPIAISFSDTVTDNGSGNPAGWTVSEPGTAAVFVSTDGAAYDAMPNTGVGNMIKMDDTDVVNACSISRSITSSSTIDMRKGYLEFKIRKSNTSTPYSIKLTDTGVRDFEMQFNGSGNIVGVGTPSNVTYQAYAASTWYKVRIEWDATSAGDYWTVWINDIMKGTARWSNGYSDYTGVDALSFTTDTLLTTTVYLDDIKIGELDSADGAGRANIAYSFSNISFNDTGGKSPYNAKATPKSPVVWFLGGGGTRWGPTYESDPYDRIRWSGTGGDVTDAFKLYNPPSTFVGNYPNINAAIAASANGDRIKVNRNITIGEVVQLPQNDSSKDVVVEGGFFIPMGGRYVSGTYTPDRAVNGYQELLANVPLGYDSSSNANNENPVRTGVTTTTPYSTSQGNFSKALVFDGSNDVLPIPDAATLDFDATTDFTVEAWVKTTSTSAGDIVSKRTNDASDGYALKFVANGTVSGVVDGALGSVTVTTVVTINDGKWHHVALAVDRNGSGDIVGAKIYIDGVERATGAQAGADTLANAAKLGIGGNSNIPGNYFNGWIDEVRISNTLRYSSAFTPSASAFASDANTMALYHFDGSILKDTSGNALHSYLSNTSTQNPTGTASGKFGNGYSFDAGDSVTVDDNNAIDFVDRASNVDFTVEAWIKTNSPSADGNLIAKKVDATLANVGYLVKYINATNSVTAYLSDGTTQITVTNAANVNDGGWHHIALTADRNGSAYLYVDGTAGAAQDMNSVVNTISNAQNLIIGSGFKGMIDEARISNTLRYAANFTASKLMPFTPDTTTRALYHFGETYITLRNAVVARGGIDVVKAQNCTIFRANSTWPTLFATNSALKNCIVEDTGTTVTTGSSIEAATCKTTWTSGSNSFNNLSLLDYHITTAAGSTVIDNAERIDNIVYDAPFYEAIDIDTTPRGFNGTGAVNSPVVGDWDIGADEFYATTKLATIGGTDIGNISRVYSAGTRGGYAFSYAVTSGSSSSSSSYDNRILVLNNSDFSVLAASVSAPGPILNFTYFRASLSPYLTYIYLVVDTDGDGQGDSIMALKDQGYSTIAADTSFDQDVVDDGIQYYGSPMKALAIIKIGTEAAGSGVGVNDPRYGRKLFFVAGGVLYKINADPSDATDEGAGTNRGYGMTIWTNSSRTYSALGAINADIDNYMYVSVSGDGTTDVVAKLLYTGFTTPAVAASWKVPGGVEAGVDQNNNGQIIYAAEANARIMIAPSDSKRIYTTQTNLGADVFKYASEKTDGDKGFDVNTDTLPFRYYLKTYAIVGAGEKIYKIKDDGAPSDPVTWSDPGAADNGSMPDTDWPFATKGSVTSRILLWGNKVFWGTKDGYCYAATFNGTSGAASDDGAVVAGFPYRLPNQRVTDVFILSTGVYFVTDQGMTVRVPIQ